MELFFTTSLTSIIWLMLLLLLVWRAWFFSKSVGGLALCHWFSMAINHFFGEFFISRSENFTSTDRNASEIGYQISAWSIVGLIGAFFTVLYFDFNFAKSKINIQSNKWDSKIGLFAIMIGLVCYFLLSGILSFIPSATSILSAGLAFSAGGLAWVYLAVFKTRGSTAGLAIASLMFFFPVFTLVLSGFMGYGIQAVLGVAGVVMATYKPKSVLLFIGPVLLYLGFSLYPSYMASRTNIREKVWGDAELTARFETTFSTISDNWQWFDPNDEIQMEILNSRMNQNVLVGYSQEYIKEGKVSYADGETIFDGLLALIPRAIWVDKPFTAGSQGLVTRFTGIKVAEGTSVGIGNLMEFYVNFGYLGVVFGFYFIGLGIYLLDSKTGQAIDTMNPTLFFACLVPGQSLMNSIGSFVEWGPSFVGSVVLVWGFTRFIIPNIVARRKE